MAVGREEGIAPTRGLNQGSTIVELGRGEVKRGGGAVCLSVTTGDPAGQERTGVMRPGYAIDPWQLPQVRPRQSALLVAIIVVAIFFGNVVFGNFLRFDRAGISVRRVLNTLDGFRFEILSFFRQLLDALRIRARAIGKALGVSRLGGFVRTSLIFNSADAELPRAAGSWLGPFAAGAVSVSGVSWRIFFSSSWGPLLLGRCI